ncbi:FAD-dependent oxidoreductase, partial [Ralstonia pseudosolanacearum]|uniref:FAD-dependent oxidoreductase n=1 Tax=Ralstonia pseudosolanacearum TaxID=1310165 RepID=UPI003CEF4AC8
MTQPSIAIVGAGIAGVACANALAAEGISATVYERGGRLFARSEKRGCAVMGRGSSVCR